MKIKFLDSPSLYSRHVRGAETLAAIGIGTMVGGIGAAGIGAASQSSTNSSNAEENEKNRKFNSEEAEKQRSWSSEQWDKQFAKQTGFSYDYANFASDLSYDSWLKQQENERAYNSPSAQVQRLQQAGLNPALAAQGGAAIGSSGLSSAPAAQAPTPSVSGASAAQAPSSLPMQNPMNSFSQVAESLGGLINGLSSAAKNSADAKRTLALVNAELNLFIAKRQNLELLNKHQELDNFFFSRKSSGELRKLGAEIKKITMETYVAEMQGNLTAEQVTGQVFNNVLTEYAGRLKQEEWMQAMIFTKEYARIIATDIDLKKSQAYNNYESGKTQASIRSVNEAQSRLLTLTGDNQEYWNNLNSEVREQRKAEVVEGLNVLKTRVKLQESLSNEFDALTEKIQKENDWYVINTLIQRACDIVNADANRSRANTDVIRMLRGN